MHYDCKNMPTINLADTLYKYGLNH